MRNVLLAVLMVIVVLAGVLFVGGYAGTPSKVYPTLSVSPNPQVAQTIQVTLSSSQYSVWPTGATFAYSIYQQATNGSYTALAYNVKVAATLTGQSGFLHTYSASVSVTTTAVCSGLNCVGSSYNITVKSQLLVSTYTSLYTSPPSTSIFSNVATYQNVPAAASPSLNGESGILLLGMVFVGILLLLGAGFLRAAWVLWGGIILLAIGVVGFVVVQYLLGT
jgi:hypothetical protein